MKVLFDINVVLDVLQDRRPHADASCRVLSRVAGGAISGLLPAHAVTTIHYLIARHGGRLQADAVVGWLISRFEIVSVGRPELVRARSLGFGDFEDAVVAACAEAAGCVVILTRNPTDFVRSPVEVQTPEEYLSSQP